MKRPTNQIYYHTIQVNHSLECFVKRAGDEWWVMSHESECAAQVAAYANAIVGLDTLAGKGSQLILGGRFMEGYGGYGPVASDVLDFKWAISR